MVAMSINLDCSERLCWIQHCRKPWSAYFGNQHIKVILAMRQPWCRFPKLALPGFRLCWSQYRSVRFCKVSGHRPEVHRPGCHLLNEVTTSMRIWSSVVLFDSNIKNGKEGNSKLFYLAYGTLRTFCTKSCYSSKLIHLEKNLVLDAYC